jgi:hypothetical protein
MGSSCVGIEPKYAIQISALIADVLKACQRRLVIRSDIECLRIGAVSGYRRRWTGISQTAPRQPRFANMEATPGQEKAARRRPF